MRRLVLLAPVVLVVAACGQTAVKPYLPGPTAKCLRSAGFKVSTGADVPLVPSTAPNGGLIAHTNDGSNTLQIAFAADAGDAPHLEQAFRRAAPKALRAHIQDVMRKKGNAVLFWTVSPTAAQEQTVFGCLRS
jgi:hypothetical protein